MGTLTFIDSAYPLSSYPAADGFAFYIGGDTPHVWTSAEVAVLKQHYRYLLPIYVRSNPPGPGAAADVASAVVKLKSLGVPLGVLVAWDSEMSVDAPYIKAVYSYLRADGYTLIEYASQSVVFAEQNPDGYYWGAEWTNVAHLHSGDVATQYVSFSGYDETEASSSLPFWDTRGPTPAPAVIMVAVNLTLPVLQQGAMDTAGGTWYVGRLQAALAYAGKARNLPAAASVTPDGDFGPATKAGVEAVQAGYGLTQDGIAGPATYGVLYQDKPA